MCEIYAIRDDGYKYQELDFDIMELLEFKPANLSLQSLAKFYKQNIALSSWRPKITSEFSPPPANPRAFVPDLSVWVNSNLVLSPKAYRLLGEALKPLGELLPVIVDGETFYIFNCLVFGEDDEAASEIEYFKGEPLGLKRLAFKSVTDNQVFKSALESCLTLYCNSRFKEMVEQHELTGVLFNTNLVLAMPDSLTNTKR